MRFTIGNPRIGGTYTDDEEVIKEITLWTDYRNEYKDNWRIGNGVRWNLEVQFLNGGAYFVDEDGYGTIQNLLIYKTLIAQTFLLRMKYGEKWRDVVKFVTVRADKTAVRGLSYEGKD